MSQNTIRTFYVLMATQVLSILGSGMTSFAIGVWVFTQTGDTTPLMLVAVFATVPMMLFTGIGGVIADRMNRRWLIILGDAGQAVPTLLLMLAFATGTFQLWMLYLATIVQTLFVLLQQPAIEASITMLVPDEERNRANAIRQISQPAAGLVAPALAGVLYSIIGVAGVMLLDVATFVIAVLVVSQINIPQPRKSHEGAAHQGSMWHELKGAFAFVYERRGMFIVILYATFLNFITGGAFNLITPYIILLTGEETFAGVVMGVFSAGLVAGGLATIVWQGTKTRMHTIMPGLTLAGIGLIFFGIVRTPLALLFVAFVMTLPYKMTNALLHSILQKKIPPDMQGRVFAMLMQLAIFAMPLSFLITGPLVDNVLEPAVNQAGWWSVVAPWVGSEAGAGMGLYFIICGALTAIVTLAVYTLPIVRRMETDMPDYVVDNEKSPDETKMGDLVLETV
jgi:MFS family permease